VRPQGFSKRERIRGSDEFTRILREGKRLRGRFLDVRWFERDEASTDPNRVGVAVGRRIGNAVLRNRLKRRIREAYRRCKGELPCRGIEMIVLATPQSIHRGAAEYEAEMRRLLQEIAGS
jgi:ribonuclease P protein component